MKTIISLLAAIFLLSSCSSTKQTPGSYREDDVYASSKDKPAATQAVPQNTVPEQKATTKEPERLGSDADQQPSQTSRTTDERGNTNNYESDFNRDDYYDYEYAARMRRFYSPVSNYGYYDNYYTNSYWYSGNPNQWGMSIYLGYPWWGPSYYSYSYCPQLFWYSGWDFGWGFDRHHPGWGWNGGGWYGYNMGYNNGYWDGYWNGYNHGYYNAMVNNYYYNSHDNSGSYYGPRVSSTHSNGNAITPHGVKFEKAEIASGFTPVKGDFHESTPRPMNPSISGNPKGNVIHNSNTNGLSPGNVETPKGNPNQSDPRPMNPNIGGNPKGNNLPIPGNIETPKGNPNQSDPRPMNPNIGGNPKGNNLPIPGNLETPKSNPNQSDPRPMNPNLNNNNNTNPRSFDRPRNHETRRNYNAPQNYEAPRNETSPRSFGGDGGGRNNSAGSGSSSHNSAPSRGFSHR